ncbi:hypothetical protein BC827DRAFT_1156104 [Russula dissimulans]|nr:hypothetical protein BC827DRAFT_1156104 [Russula dissimulans]
MYPQFARRHIIAEERQAHGALLLRSPRGQRDLPPDLAAVCLFAATRDFRRITRVTARFLQALVQEGGERERGAPRVVGRAGGQVVRLGVDNALALVTAQDHAQAAHPDSEAFSRAPRHSQGQKTLTATSNRKTNEAEIALRREETARKRKYLSEKKLEDEKAETINRLLKKSGTRNRHNQLASAEDRILTTHTGNGPPTEGEVGEEESGEVTVVPVVEVVPTCHRWISTSKPSPMHLPGTRCPLILHTHLVTTSAAPASARQRRGCDDGDTGTSSSKSRDHGPQLSVIWTDARQRGSIDWSMIGNAVHVEWKI